MLHAQDGHQLWLRDKKALPVNVICKKNSPTLTIARQELQNGWQGAPGATISLIIKKDKALKDDGFKIRTKVLSRPILIKEFYMVFMNCCVPSKRVRK